MSVLRSLETKIAGLVEGAFGRAFRSEIRPVELARRLAREMDAHRTATLEHVYAPSEYRVWLSPADRAHFEGVEQAVIDELAAYLLEHARSERLALPTRPQIEFATDEHLSLGECDIEVGSAGAAELADEAPQQAELAAERGHTMIYSRAERIAAPLAARPGRAFLSVDGRRMLIGPAGATLGRSRECDIVISGDEVSRRHARIEPTEDGWQIVDLDSTNGVRLNGHTLRAPAPLKQGDTVELGTGLAVFELE